MTEIRAAGANDGVLLHSLITELASYEKEEAAVKVSAAELTRQLAMSNRPFECLIAEHEGAPAGFALYFYAYSTWEGTETLYLEDLFVRPEFRGERIGLALMSALAEIARGRKCTRLEWSVLNWNELAINFYERLGAQPLDGWTRYRLTVPAMESLMSAASSAAASSVAAAAS